MCSCSALKWVSCVHSDVPAECSEHSAVTEGSQYPAQLSFADMSLLGQGGSYGTRSQTVIAVWRDGRAELRERFRGLEDEWSEVQHTLSIDGIRNSTCSAPAQS